MKNGGWHRLLPRHLQGETKKQPALNVNGIAWLVSNSKKNPAIAGFFLFTI
jgi:hypothetical protein